MDIELVPIALFFSIVAITKIIADSRTRNKLIAQGVSAEEAKALLAPVGRSGRDASLKWGLVTAAIGAALIVVHVAPFDGGGPAVPGLILLAAGTALLVHYFLSGLGAGRWWTGDAAR